MATYSHPGVFIEEVPVTRSIQGASTSTPAFIGATDSGPYLQPTLITSWNEYQRVFGNLAWYAMVSWSVYEFFREGGTVCWVVRCDTKDGASVTSKTDLLAISAASPGAWGNAISVMISNSPDTPPVGNAQPTTTPVFNLTVYAIGSQLVTADNKPAPMPNLLLKEYVDANKIAPKLFDGDTYYALESFNGLTGASLVVEMGEYSLLAKKINGTSMFIRVDKATKTVILPIPGTPRDSPANTAKPTALIGGAAPEYDFDAATQLLTKVQGLSLLALPDIPTTEVDGGGDTQATQGAQINAALLFCEQQRNLFYVIDPPFGLKLAEMVSFKTGQGTETSGNPNALSSDFGAIYYPWVYIYNPVSASMVPVPPSGPTLGRYAYIDATVGVFKSPADVNDGALKSCVLLGQNITDSDQDLLNPQGINAIRNFINYGNVVWGARTLAVGTEWTYISIRRLFIYVEQSLKQSLPWVVFEPNGQQLWSSVSRDISAFLTTLWQQGGLFGATASEAFFVTCDASNNPQNTRALGYLYIDIGLAPLYPAEFVVLRMTQMTAVPA